MTIQGCQLAVEVRLVLQALNLLYELVLDLVVDVQRLKTLANLEFEEVVSLLNLLDVHLLELKQNFSKIKTLTFVICKNHVRSTSCCSWLNLPIVVKKYLRQRTLGS